MYMSKIYLRSSCRDSNHIFSNSGRLFIVVGGHSEELLYVKYQRVFVVIKTTSKGKYILREVLCATLPLFSDFPE